MTFPTVGDRVKVLAGHHLGKLGEVYHVDESRMSPILVVGGDFRDWYRPDEVEIQPKCGCHLNDEGRGHWSACPEAEVSETEPGPTLAHLRQAEKAGLERGDSFTYIPGPEPVSETEPEEISAEELRFYPLENWRRDVANAYTELGYKAWVAEQQKAARAKIRQTIQVEEVDPEMVQPWKSGNFAIVDDDLGGAIAYASTELLAEVIRDAIRERNRE